MDFDMNEEGSSDIPGEMPFPVDNIQTQVENKNMNKNRSCSADLQKIKA
jgi:hypothetical protein